MSAIYLPVKIVFVELGITPNQRMEVIMNLSCYDYSEGPIVDALNNQGEMWVFGRERNTMLDAILVIYLKYVCLIHFGRGPHITFLINNSGVNIGEHLFSERRALV